MKPESKHSILCVDDEADNVDALERLFRRKLQVFKATSAAQGLELLAKHPVTVIISDQRMPQMTGVEFLQESLKTHPNAIRILLTGYTDIDSVIAAINSGQIYRYVTKPWDPVDLANAVDRAIERYEIGEELVEKNRALQLALEELQTLDQAKNQFMVLVNHELKTPLTSIMSFTDLLGESRLDQDQSKMLTRIKSAAVRLQEMIGDALEFVSAETSQTRIDLKPLAASHIFGASSLPEAIAAAATARQVEFEFAIENQTVVCDEKLIRNVFRRLTHNAAKFATTGTKVIVRGSSVNGRYLVAIENHGTAIDERRIDQLMKPFTLNENVLNHSIGTGLGLPISQALLKLQGAKLRFAAGGDRVIISFDLGLST